MTPAPSTPATLAPAPQKAVRYVPKIYGMALFISVLTVISIIAVFLYADRELERDMLRWQDKLNLIAESRSSEVTEWVSSHFKALDQLADNASLQLYLTELQALPDSATQDAAQAAYLRNMLNATAEQMGFSQPQSRVAEQMKANVQELGAGGIAILDSTGKMLVATAGMPAVEDKLAERVAAAPRGVPSLLDMEAQQDGSVQVGFLVPVFAIQSDMEQNQQIGSILGIRPVNGAFYALLKHPGVIENTLETYLVRQEQENILYLSPLKDKSSAMGKRMNADAGYLDAAFAIAEPGRFALKKDYSGHDVLVTGRTVPLTPWTLVVKVDRTEALADSDKRRSQMITIFLLVIATVIATMVAVWRHASSRKAFELSVKATRLAAQTAAQEKLLRLVTNNQPEPIFITDREQRVRFANSKMAEAYQSKAADLYGKPLESVMGPAMAKDYIQANRTALATGRPYSYVRRLEGGEAPRILKFEHVPLAHIPIEGLPEPTPGVLVVEQNITEAVSERERRLRIQNQLIETLIKMMDQRDPYASQHSGYVAMVARAVAEEMELNPTMTETAEIAGKLMNIGKIVIPPEMLTRAKGLNDKERQSIRDSMLASADLLKHIEFDGPVVESLRQAGERWDGTGPLKLRGNDILVTAQIVSLANALIAMVSPRSYRAAIGVDEAIKTLLDDIDKQYDRKVVIALVNYLDNKGGRRTLDKLAASGEPDGSKKEAV